MPFRGGGGGYGDTDWAESIANNLVKIYERMDERDVHYTGIRKDIRENLDGFLRDENGRVIEVTRDTAVNYDLVLRMVEGLHLAIRSPWWRLMDCASLKAIKTARIMDQLGDKIRLLRQKRLISNVRTGFRVAGYENWKVNELAIEDAESLVRHSVLGILGDEAAPMLQSPEIMTPTRKHIQNEHEKNLADDDDGDDDGDDQAQPGTRLF